MTRIRHVCPAVLTFCAAVSLNAQPDLRTIVKAWVDSHQQQIVAELIQLLSIPNIAADRPNIRRNAVALVSMLRQRGFTPELLETEGNPLVYGELRVPGASRTLLLYAHYDGQPVEPKSWKQEDPFSPVVRTGRVDQGGQKVADLASVTKFEDDWRVYARSASDDKSPIVALCAALDALKASGLVPTSNLRVVLDGEEEASSPSLVPAIGRYGQKLRADAIIILDGPGHSSGRPTIVFGARGIVTFDLTVFGPKVGAHSGNYGNWMPNPALRLASLLSSMKNDDGRVTVPGFYDAVTPFSAADRALLDGVPDDSERMLKTFGIAKPERGFPKLQEAVQYPTLNIRGLASSHVGPGARTIIPDRAVAAMDIRLVKETTAADLIEKLQGHIRRQGYHLVGDEPDDATRAEHDKIARLAVSGSSTRAYRTSPDDPQATAVIGAITRTYGAPPVLIRTLGGTVPIAQFIDALSFPAIGLPVVNFDNNQHEENENLRIGHLFEAVVTIAALLRM